MDDAEEEEQETIFVSPIDFDTLREQFPNIVAWIQSEGTPINYPIVQGSDNDYYLHRFPDGTRNKMGSIFLDYRNSNEFSDTGIIIYGRNTATGDMFGTLRNYRNQQYFEKHPVMFIFTPTASYEVRLFAGYVLDSAVEVPPMRFDSQESFERFIENIRRRSAFKSDIEVNYGDRLVFKATYTGVNVNDRLIIVGVLTDLEAAR
jgi:sortase B